MVGKMEAGIKSILSIAIMVKDYILQRKRLSLKSAPGLQIKVFRYL